MFCLKLGKNDANTFEILKTAFGNERLSRTRTFDWFRKFKKSRTSVDDHPRSGRLSVSVNDDFMALVGEISTCK